MTDAAVKFDFLSTEPHKTCIPVFTACGRGISSVDARSEGSFVLYNYARLATLVLNYEKAVENGTYPPLSMVMEQSDYSLLTNEEEWGLVYSYILQFPVVLSEASSMEEKSLQVKHSELKKVCQFLIRMCHTFSGYYSRFKVLLSPEPHLLPLIKARMALVLALKQVLYNGLLVLGIHPPNQL